MAAPGQASIVTPASLVTYPVAFAIVKGGFELAKVLGDWGKSPWTAIVLAVLVSLALLLFSDAPGEVPGGRPGFYAASFFLVLFNTIVLASAAFGVGAAANEAADKVT